VTQINLGIPRPETVVPEQDGRPGLGTGAISKLPLPGRAVPEWEARGDPLACTGGTYRVSMQGGVEALGEFVALDLPHRHVFTWGWNHDHALAQGSARLVVTFAAEDRHPRGAAPLRLSR